VGENAAQTLDCGSDWISFGTFEETIGDGIPSDAMRRRPARGSGKM
jgi:hypothetical protein